VKLILSLAKPPPFARLLRVLRASVLGEPNESPKTPGPDEIVSSEDQNKEHKRYA